jgi:cytochrome P450
MSLASQVSIQERKITAPGPRGLPLLGNLLFMSQYKYQHQALSALAKEYGDVVQLHIGPRPVVALSGLETIKQALVKQSVEFAGRPDLFTLRTVIQGRTMGGRDYGPLYKKHREIAANAMRLVFTNGTIVPIEQQIVEEAEELVNGLLGYNGQPFDPSVELGLAAAGVMFRILFGDKNCRENEDCVDLVRYAKYFAANTVGSLIVDFIPQARPLCGKGIESFLTATYIMERLIVKKLAEHRKTYDPDHLIYLVDGLMKAASEMDKSELEALGITETPESLLVEGTTQELMGTGLQPLYPLMRWLVLYMVAYPEVQAKVQQELDAAIEPERSVCLEDRAKLPYTEACIHEILRHAPLFPLTIPHATTTDTAINGYFIPQNTFVLVNLYSLTRDERYWENPESFEPSRFLSESGTIKEELLEKYYPFGLGKRRCFGEHLGRIETFLFFTNLLHRCKFESVPEQAPSMDGVPGTMIHPKDHPIIVKPRF